MRGIHLVDHLISDTASSHFSIPYPRPIYSTLTGVYDRLKRTNMTWSRSQYLFFTLDI